MWFLDVILMEACDALQGFQFVHSLPGRTGSGLRTLLSNSCGRNLPIVLLANSIVPPAKVSDTVASPITAPCPSISSSRPPMRLSASRTRPSKTFA
jgi:hypothetical protein